MIQIVNAQPIKAGSTEIVIGNNHGRLVFDNIHIEDSCSSYSKCIYIINSKKNNFSVEITTASFSQNINPISLRNGNIVVNTGIKLGDPFSIQTIKIYEKNRNDQMSVRIVGGNNLNNQVLNLEFSQGNYEMLISSSFNETALILDDYCLKSIKKSNLFHNILKRISKRTLLDSIFKNTFYENCESGHQNGDIIYSRSFYTDGILNKYTFIKLFKDDIYVLSQAEIQSNNTPLKVQTEKGIIGIGYSKASIAQAFNIDPKICDTLEISDEDGGSNHWLFFENDLLKKIVLINNIN